MSAGSVPAKIDAVISVDDGVSAPNPRGSPRCLCSNANESCARLTRSWRTLRRIAAGCCASKRRLGWANRRSLSIAARARDSGVRRAARRGPRAGARTRLGRRALAVRGGRRALLRAGARGAAQRLRGGRRCAVRRRDRHRRAEARRRASRSCTGCTGSPCGWRSAEPLLLVVDDAHWADEPSLRFLSICRPDRRAADRRAGGHAADEPAEAGCSRSWPPIPTRRSAVAAAQRGGRGRAGARARCRTPTTRSAGAASS